MRIDFRRAPLTHLLVATLGLAAVVGLVAPALTAALAAPPAGLLLYPWAFPPSGSPLGLLFLAFFAMWLLQFGSSVEGELGPGRFAGFWAASTLLPGLVAAAMGKPLFGPWLPASAILVAWCARNRGAGVAFWGMPVSTPVLAGIVSAMAILPYLAGPSPLLGLALALPLGLAWAFGAGRLPVPYAASAARRRADEPVVKGGTKYDAAYYENVNRREVEREERERLRKLFEGK